MHHNSSAWEACSVQFSCSACLTLWDPMDCSTPGLPVHHQLLELAQTHFHWVTDAIQPSHPLFSPSPPAMRCISMTYILDDNYHEYSHWAWPYYQCTSFNIPFCPMSLVCVYQAISLKSLCLFFCSAYRDIINMFLNSIGMGKTCEPKAFSFQCMTKFTTNKKKIK